MRMWGGMAGRTLRAWALVLVLPLLAVLAVYVHRGASC